MNIGVMNTWLCVLLFGTAYSTIHKSKDGLFDIHHKMSNDELLKYFGVSTSDNVPEYDISYPMPANEEGNLISRERAKRDVDQYSQNKYYHMSAFGRTLHFNVTVNENLLGPNFYIETRNKDGLKTFADAPHRNFYHGHVVSQPNSFVALSDNEGVSGAIRVADDEMLFVHPLPDNLLPARDQSNEKRPHLVVKRSTSDFRQMFEEEDPPEMAEDWRYAEYRYPADAPQPDHKFLEVIYVGDHLITQQIGLFELPEMLLIIGNIVSRMFTDSTFGERKLTYTVTKVLILNNGELDYSKSASNGAKLSVFGRWLKANNPADDKDPEHSDTGTLFTSYTGGGLALAGGMCSYRDMRAIVGSIGLSSSAIVAHENFHNLGFGHDVDGGCPNGANIMSTYVPSGHAAFTWSNCSRQYIQRYLRSRWSHCLNDAPQAKRPTLPPLLRGQLPGTIFDGDKQCELKHSVGYKQCFKNGCGTLFCTNNGVSCHSSGGTPADGTRCGEGKWCIRGECVDNGLPPVHGNWGSWSDYTSCTRTCGGGIKHRERKCDNPRPQNKGNPCSGSNIGEYKTCNTKACLIGSKSFREVQCKEKNVNYTAHLASGNVCSLWCRRGNIAYLRGKVKDGTRCSNDPMNLNVCVNGECQIVGCDNQLYSEKVYDRCHTCDGDGSKCELRTVNYTKNHRKYGAKKGDTMVVLKKGSSNIHAKMRGKTWNVIGVQNATGEYLINLPSWSKTVYKAGAKIAYIHRKNQYDDEIIITGRVTEELRLVFVYIRTRNQGVDIKYYSPLKNATKPSKEMFYWTSGEWSVCSKTCAGGQVQRKVSCLRHDDDSQVTNTACSEKSKPLSKKSCSTQDCPPEWHSSLTSCSKTCGKGVQLRKTVCRQKNVKSWTIVENSRCVQPPPTDLPIERFCNKITCPPQYVALPWSQCSTTCGKGVMTRALKCEILNDAGITDTLPNETCEHHNAVKPSTKEKCNYDKPCEHTPQYVKIGCFKDRYGKRRVLNWIVSLRPEIDWWNPGATIKKCARLAREHSQVYFAIQFYGECWASSDPNVKYDKYGVSKNSWKGLGGSWTNCVYKLLKKKSA